MDQLIADLNAAASALLALLCGWAVMSRRVRDGVGVKAGLICMALGFAARVLLGAGAGPRVCFPRADLLIHAGLLVAAAGWVYRQRRHGRRITDWTGLLVEPPRVHCCKKGSRI